jgi:hypothetical protein
MTRSTPPPRTTMPSGAPLSALQVGNRVTMGKNSKLPMGENPQTTKPATQTARSFRPKDRYRLQIKIRPTEPILMRKLDGMDIVPMVFETRKNNAPPSFVAVDLVQRHSGSIPSCKQCLLGFFTADQSKTRAAHARLTVMVVSHRSERAHTDGRQRGHLRCIG